MTTGSTSMTADEVQALAEAVGDVLADHCSPERLAAAEGAVDRRLWDVLAASGLHRVGIAESAGGSGGGLAEAATVLRLVGEHAAPVPLAEVSMLAGWLLETAGLPQPDGIATTGPAELAATRVDGGWRVRGRVHRVPAAGEAELVVVVAQAATDTVVVALPLGDLVSVAGSNLAGESRDELVLDLPVPTVYPVPARTAELLRLRGALSRAVLSAGALDRLLALTVRYAQERQQFGRPIAKFQAVQQAVATLAAEAAAAGACVDAAVRACDADLGAPEAALAVAAAKVRTAQAASTGAAIAHQVHGALGMTFEHVLRFSTTRLWAWGSEWGSEAEWSEELAERAVAAGADGLWPLLVAT